MPSPLYLLLSSPAGWVGTAQHTKVIHALETHAWPFDPNETPEGSPPLLEAVLKGFNTPSVSTGDGKHHLRLEAFKAVVTALFGAGARLDPDLPSISFSGYASRWFERISRAGAPHAKDLSTVEQGLDILEKSGGPGLKNFRQWCVENKLNLSAVLAGESLLAHVAAGACITPLGLKRQQMGMSPEGWLLHGKNGEGAIWNNQASAHQRLADAMVIHQWLESSEKIDASQKALWWLMAWPLSNQKTTHAKPEKRQDFDEAFKAISKSSGLVDALDDLLATSGPALKPQLAQLVLAAAGDLPRNTPSHRIWDLMSQALLHHPHPRPDLGLEFWWNVDSPGDGHMLSNARAAIKSLVEQWGWPTAVWAESASLKTSDLVHLWAVGMAGGQLPSTDDLPAGHWRLWSIDDGAIKWPSQAQVERWFVSNGLKNQAIEWHRNGERAELALARMGELETRLDTLAVPRPKVRM